MSANRGAVQVDVQRETVRLEMRASIGIHLSAMPTIQDLGRIRSDLWAMLPRSIAALHIGPTSLRCTAHCSGFPNRTVLCANCSHLNERLPRILTLLRDLRDIAHLFQSRSAYGFS